MNTQTMNNIPLNNLKIRRNNNTTQEDPINRAPSPLASNEEMNMNPITVTNNKPKQLTMIRKNKSPMRARYIEGRNNNIKKANEMRNNNTKVKINNYKPNYKMNSIGVIRQNLKPGINTRNWKKKLSNKWNKFTRKNKNKVVGSVGRNLGVLSY